MNSVTAGSNGGWGSDGISEDRKWVASGMMSSVRSRSGGNSQPHAAIR
jgi:hypothetical protein